MSEIGSNGLRTINDYYATLTQSREVSNELGKDDFLKLLATQMQYQDPLEPTSDTDFIAQLAQFSTLEQMTNLNETMYVSESFNLAGKFVLATVPTSDGYAEIYGIVDRVIIQDGVAYVQISGYDYAIEASYVTQVWDLDLVSGDNPLVDAAKLIGRVVTGTVSAEDAEETDEEDEEAKTREVTGVVTRVAIEDGVIYVFIETEDGETEQIALGNITNVQDAGTGTGTGTEGGAEETDGSDTDPGL